MSVTVSARMGFVVGVPNPLQGHVLLGQLVLYVCPVRLRTSGHRHRLWKQQHLKLLIGQPVRERPGQPGRLGAGQVILYRCTRQLHIASGQPLAVALAVVVPQQISDSSHSNSFLWHRSLLCEKEQ